jgi:predicted nucleic acid-binding protein
VSVEYLVDTSAWNRSNTTAEVSSRWTDLVASGQVALCPPVRLELLFSARGPADYAAFADEIDGLPSCPLSRRAVDRAECVQALLAGRSQHRGPNPVDLFVAAIAELNELTVVHYDRHFDAIARVTRQPTEWIAPRGTLD